MKLKPERYRGISIRIVKNVTPNKKAAVEASAKVRGNVGTYVAPTKELAVLKAKKWIDKIL